MSVTINGSTGVTTPGISNSEGYTGDGLTIAAGAPSGAMTLNASGNLGVGTTSPTSRLDIASGNITISNSTNAPFINFVDNTTRSQSLARITMDQVSGTAGQLLFSTTTEGTLSERARIDSSGNLLVGTTSATVGAHHFIQSNNELNLAASITTNTLYFNYRAGTTLTSLRFMNGNSAGGYVACYGTSFTNSSDYRIKTDVQEVGSVLPKIAQLRPVNYIKEGVEGREFGLIAHEAQAVFPDMVSGEKDAVDEDGDMEIQGIDYAQLSTILVKAVQEQQAIIDAQQAALTQLQADVAAMKGQA